MPRPMPATTPRRRPMPRSPSRRRRPRRRRPRRRPAAPRPCIAITRRSRTRLRRTTRRRRTFPTRAVATRSSIPTQPNKRSPMKMKSSLLCACAVVALAGPALAEPPIARPKDPAALKHLDVATKLYDIRSFVQAIEEYLSGALVEPAPVFDFDLAQCYRQLHKYMYAIWHYQRFLKESPETVEHDEAVKKFIEQMQAELDQKAMTAPPTEDANAPASAKPTAPASPTPTAPTATNEEEETPPPAPTDAWYRDPLGWSLVGGGVAALGASTYFLLGLA